MITNACLRNQLLGFVPVNYFYVFLANLAKIGKFQVDCYCICTLAIYEAQIEINSFSQKQHRITVKNITSSYITLITGLSETCNSY